MAEDEEGKSPVRVNPIHSKVFSGDKDKHYPKAILELRSMIRDGNADNVRRLLEQGADPNELRALLDASRNGHTDIVKMLLDKGADPKEFGVLLHASRNGHTDIVKMLLDKGADPEEYEVLEQAACNGHTDIVKMLLDQGADPKQSGVLKQAACYGHTDIVKMLMDQGADPKQFDVLWQAACNGHTDIVKMLLDKGVDPKQFRVLRQPACNGHTDIVKMLLDKGADPKESGALWHAARNGHTDIIKMLLDKKADPKEFGALTQAVCHGHTNIVKMLLDKGADPKESGVLWDAARNGHTDIIKMLLDKKADPKESGVLTVAACYGHTDTVKMLLDQGADPKQLRALWDAACNGHTDIVKMLLDKGADPKEFRVLRQSACNGHTDIVKMLLDKGADPKESGVLTVAACYGHTDIVKMLLDQGADPKQSGALEGALSGGHTDIAEILMEKREDPNQRIQRNYPAKGILDYPEVCLDKGLHSAMTSNISSADKDYAKRFMKIVKERNMDDFNMLEKTFATTYQNDDSCASLLHSVAVYGTAIMVELMHNWNGIKWDEQYTVSGNRFGDTLDAINVEKATALYIATFLDRTEVAESLVRCAGEDNIRCCFQNIQLSTKMEEVFMLELAKRLKQKHCELQPAIVPGHKQENGDIRLRVLIVYSQDVVQASEYDLNGLALVKLRNPYVIKKAAILEPNIETKLCDKAIDKTKKAITIHRQVLWKKHSNLNIITGSHIKYRRNETDIEKRHCVVLYCSTKGVIPLGEERFPRRLYIDKDDYIDVDVREGFFEQSYTTLPSTWPHPTLKMGCNIGRLQFNAQGERLIIPGGTLGPFVRYNGNLGFLTCAHVLFDIPSPASTLDFTGSAANLINVVQPSTDATSFQGGVACGAVERAIFDPTQDPSIDAAVVTLTDPARFPNAGQFSNELQSSYKHAGLNDLPEYNNGALLTVAGINGLEEKPNVVKFGSRTDVTKGALAVFCADVRPLSTALGLPNGVGYVEMINQYQVFGIPPSPNFLEKGDSGSGVFCKDHRGVFNCIGMAIGSMTTCDYYYRPAVVTPIEAVLQALGPNLTLATFP